MSYQRARIWAYSALLVGLAVGYYLGVHAG